MVTAQQLPYSLVTPHIYLAQCVLGRVFNFHSHPRLPVHSLVGPLVETVSKLESLSGLFGLFLCVQSKRNYRQLSL